MVVFLLRQLFSAGRNSATRQAICKYEGCFVIYESRAFQRCQHRTANFWFSCPKIQPNEKKLLIPPSGLFWTIPEHMDRKRMPRRFRISNLRQRGRIIARDMAGQIFVSPALRNISISHLLDGQSAPSLDLGPSIHQTDTDPVLRCRP